MKRQYATLLSILFCLPAVPVLAQTTIGGGACTSSTLNGTYQFLLNGRQVTAAGTTSKLFPRLALPLSMGSARSR